MISHQEMYEWKRRDRIVMRLQIGLSVLFMVSVVIITNYVI